MEKRAFIAADIGAARRGLNVLARACSGAMFPRRPPPPFTLRGSLWTAPNAVLSPSSRVILILLILPRIVKKNLITRDQFFL